MFISPGAVITPKLSMALSPDKVIPPLAALIFSSSAFTIPPENVPASMSMASALTLPVKVTAEGPATPPMVRSPKVVIVLAISVPLVSRSISPSELREPRSSAPPPVLPTSIKPLVAPGSLEAIEVVVMLPAAVSKTPPPLSASRAPVVIDVPASRSILPFKAFTAAVVIAPIASISTVAPVRDAVAV